MRLFSVLRQCSAGKGLALAAGVCLLLFATASQAKPERYRLDPAHLSIAFLTHHIGFADTLGQFLKAEGRFIYDEETQSLSDLEVTIDAASVFTNHEARDKHLRSKDFLDVAQHPIITFRMTEAIAKDTANGEVRGDLTILGVTQPVSLDVTLNKAGDYPFPIGGAIPYVLGISARTTIERSAFGMTYAVENGWVGDEVEIILELEAVRQ